MFNITNLPSIYLVYGESNINLLYIFFAFILGFIGSACYLSALNFGFLGVKKEYRNIIKEPFLNNKRKICLIKFSWFCVLGGLCAAVFQLPMTNAFASIQSFIIGCSWPSLVLPFLSSRMHEPTPEEKSEMDKLQNQMDNMKKTSITINQNKMKEYKEEVKEN